MVQQKHNLPSAYFSSNSMSFWANRSSAAASWAFWYAEDPANAGQTSDLGHMQQMSGSKKKSFPPKPWAELIDRAFEYILWIAAVFFFNNLRISSWVSLQNARRQVSSALPDEY